MAGNIWLVRRRFTRVRRLFLRALPAGARVQLRCRGRRCAFKRRSLATRAGTADAGRRLARVKLRPGTVLTLRITAPGAPVQVLRYKIRRGKRPVFTRMP
jgi:hypothetical protein